MSHPLLTIIARTHVRQALVAKGHRLSDAINLASAVDAETVDTALTVSPPEVNTAVTKVSAIGDGTILNAIIAFFNSDLGKTLEAIILKLITGV